MINFNKYYLKQSTSYYYFNKNYAIILKVAVEILLFERIFVNPILLLFIMSILIIYSIVIYAVVVAIWKPICIIY